MLAAIRANLAASQPFDQVHDEHHAQLPVLNHQAQRADSTNTDESKVNSPGDILERFRQALEALKGDCVIVRDEREAAQVLQRIVDQTRARHIAVSNSPLVESVIGGLKFEGELLERAGAAALFASDLGISAVQWGIAETGTLVLESDREHHRLVSLVPPVHVALIQAQQIRESLGEILSLISENGEEGLSRAVTFITGPSRTSDIELTLAIGVHGPTALHVIIIEKEPAAA